MNFFSRSRPADEPEVEFLPTNGYTGDAWMTPSPNQETLLRYHNDYLKIGDKVVFTRPQTYHEGVAALVVEFHRGQTKPGHEEALCNIYDLQAQTMIFDVAEKYLKRKSEYAEYCQDSRTGMWSWHEPIGETVDKRARGRYKTQRPF